MRNFVFSIQIRNIDRYNWQLGFNKPANEIMSGIIDLHHTIMFYLIIVFVLVSVLLLAIIFGFGQKSNLFDNKYTNRNEFNKYYLLAIYLNIITWLILMSFLSLSIAYAEEEFGGIGVDTNKRITINVLYEHLARWSYEYSDYVNPEYSEDPLTIYGDSIGHTIDELNRSIKLVVHGSTARDVPFLNLEYKSEGHCKIYNVYSTEVGHFYGRSNEMWISKGYKPIHVEIVSLPEYFSWIVCGYLNDKSLGCPRDSWGPLSFAYQYARKEQLSQEEITAFIEKWYEKKQDFDEFIQFL
jgi:heme/copper-type cytochrome/quinol oxidase subunit 2